MRHNWRSGAPLTSSSIADTASASADWRSAANRVCASLMQKILRQKFASCLLSCVLQDGQMTTAFVETSLLRIGYEAPGPDGAFPAILPHGRPDDGRPADPVPTALREGGVRASAACR